MFLFAAKNNGVSCNFANRCTVQFRDRVDEINNLSGVLNACKVNIPQLERW